MHTILPPKSGLKVSKQGNAILTQTGLLPVIKTRTLTEMVVKMAHPIPHTPKLPIQMEVVTSPGHATGTPGGMGGGGQRDGASEKNTTESPIPDHLEADLSTHSPCPTASPLPRNPCTDPHKQQSRPGRPGPAATEAGHGWRKTGLGNFAEAANTGRPGRGPSHLEVLRAQAHLVWTSPQ